MLHFLYSFFLFLQIRAKNQYMKNEIKIDQPETVLMYKIKQVPKK